MLRRHDRATSLRRGVLEGCGGGVLAGRELLGTEMKR
jgi:hypothetical protein